MTTTDRVSTSDFGRIDVLYDEDQKTVTFVADRNESENDGETVPPTEWITAPTEDTVELKQYR
jgi:hypothetical protein